MNNRLIKLVICLPYIMACIAITALHNHSDDHHDHDNQPSSNHVQCIACHLQLSTTSDVPLPDVAVTASKVEVRSVLAVAIPLLSTIQNRPVTARAPPVLA